MDPVVSRRQVLMRMAAGAAVVAIQSSCGPISPRAARAQGMALKRLSPEEGATFAALGDVLLPGAADAGIAHYVDDQLGRENPLLFLKYMDWPDPYPAFYKDGLASLERYSLARFGSSFTDVSSEQRVALVREIAATTPPSWTGPPAPLFYFVSRNDALDVYYGTAEGLEKLEIPYMAHIVPPAKW